jgi:hypothetical protein
MASQNTEKVTASKLPKSPSQDNLELGKIGFALIAWGIIGILISFYFNSKEQQVVKAIKPLSASTATINETPASVIRSNQIGPIIVTEPGQVYEVIVSAHLPSKHWSFVEVEALDQGGNFLYSFGQELWHEVGTDSDGPWQEKRTTFETKLTFSEPGGYLLNFVLDSYRNIHPKTLKVELIKRKGSDLLHFWFGILLCIVGLILVEIRHGIFKKVIESMLDDE